MPERDRIAKAPFEREARHLFRHLDDAKALRRNPLVAGYFRDAAHDGRLNEEILLEIRADLLSAARLCHTRDAWAGRERRTLPIVRHLCNGKSPKHVAADLKISLPQFYRDRREAILCTVATFLERRNRHLTVDVADELQRVQLLRIETLIDQGFSGHASAEAQSLLQSAGSPHDAVLALCAYSDATRNLGELRSATEACSLARKTLRETRNDAVTHAMLDARIRRAEYFVASVESDPKKAYQIIWQLVAEFRRPDFKTPLDSSFGLGVFLAACHAAVLAGKLTEAAEAIDFASEIVLRHEVRPALESQLAFMRAFAGQGRASTTERQEMLMTALRSGQRTGSATGILSASLGLVDHCVANRQEEKARAHAEVAFRVARAMQGSYITAIAADALAAVLLRTSQWRYAAQLLDETEFPSSPYYALRRETYAALLLLREKQFRKAADALLQCKREAHRLGQFRTLAIVLPDLALAQWRCGMHSVAQETAREAVPVVQLYGSFSMVRLAREILKQIPTG